MVASISARGSAEGAERLSLRGPVTQAEFEAALSGVDPKTGECLVQQGGRVRQHSAGWDMTFSAPKSVSVLWALSNEPERQAIEQARRRLPRRSCYLLLLGIAARAPRRTPRPCNRSRIISVF